MSTMNRVRLAGAPTEYLEPAVRPSLEEAKAYCKHLAETHYENFHVATWFLPARLRPHFQSIYCYCRIADDLGDEVKDRELALVLLDEWQQMLDECYDAPEQSRHPVFVALAETIRACDIPREPFCDLLISFRLDQSKSRFATLDEVVDYSRSSANPVGRLVLYACGYRDAERQALSDKTCTALQLANFWQDVSQDIRERGRIYVPLDWMARFGVTEADVKDGRDSAGYRMMMAGLVAYTREMFAEGARLPETVDRELALTLRLFTKGGVAILDAMERDGFDTITKRPIVSKGKKIALLLGALTDKLGVTGR